MALFCNHDWKSRTGMDSGSICGNCGTISSREVNLNKSSGLNNGTLEDKITSLRNKHTKTTIKKNIEDLFRL